MVDRMDRQDKAAVTGQVAPWWMLLWLVILLASGFWRHGTGWLAIIAELILLLLAAVGVGSGWRRRMAYRRGWFEGRRAMHDSMHEAAQRGLTPGEWLVGEMERDVNNHLGLHWRVDNRRRPPAAPDGSHEDLP